jgi:tripeptidyl-peptidase-1
MNLYLLLLNWIFVIQTLGAPSSHHVVHQKRDPSTARRWATIEDDIDRRATIPLSIALSQRNLELGYDYLMDVSDPNSSNYGKHWTAGQVGRFDERVS